MAAHGHLHGCPPPALLLSSCGPSRSTRVWGERATRRDLLSPCPVQASMIAHFPLENEDLAGAFPASSSRGRWLSSSALPAEALFSSVAQQEVKMEVKVEVKYHLRAGDFERASFYTQSRQDSSPGCVRPTTPVSIDHETAP